jgi:hypothetical protein
MPSKRSITTLASWSVSVEFAIATSSIGSCVPFCVSTLNVTRFRSASKIAMS